MPITDFRRYSFVLNNAYIPDSPADQERFAAMELSPTERNLAIRASFDRCITTDSDVLQGCVWDIRLSEVTCIEILPNDGYRYGSLNHVKADGRRRNWQQEFKCLLTQQNASFFAKNSSQNEQIGVK